MKDSRVGSGDVVGYRMSCSSIFERHLETVLSFLHREERGCLGENLSVRRAFIDNAKLPNAS